MNTSIENAEQIKLEYGYALPKDTSDSEFFPVETIGKVNPERVSEHYLAEIIEARERQIFETLNRFSFTVYFQPSLSKAESLIMSHFVYLYIFY